MMTDYVEVSKSDVTNGQSIAVFFLLFGSALITFFLITQFSISLLILWGTFLATAYIVLFKSRLRNVYYENGKIYLKDLFYKEVYDIAKFKSISRNALSGYTIKFLDNKEFSFMLSTKERIGLLSKSDPDYYAKDLTNRLNALKFSLNSN